MSAELVALLYLVAGVLFILALRGLSSPETSRQGNYMAMSGMAIAVVTTLAVAQPATALSWALIVGGIAVGGTIGAVIARRIAMTAMPELVAAFHSLVGLAATSTAARPTSEWNAATSSGIAVMAMRRAITAPMVPPTAMPPTISAQESAVAGWATASVVTTAMAMPDMAI